MSIKDLFSKSKVAVYESAESASADLESADFLKKKVEDNNTFIPFTDFSDPSQFIKFGSAELYYENSIKRVYQQYPYDGSAKEKLEYQLSSSYLDRWLYENKYPKSTGYAILTAGGYGASTITDGYGLSADHEYIYAAGGIHTASEGMKSGELFKNFDSSIKYDADKNRTQNFRVNPVDGTTVEFWLKKDEFIPSSTEKEVVLDLWNGEDSSSVDYGRLTIYLSASTDGLDTVRATLQNGTTGFADQSLAASSFTTSSIADGNWHHYAVSFLSQSSGIKTFFYVDGDLNNEQTIGSAGIDELSGRMNAYVGALQASPSGSAAAQYAGKLSGSIDEFRFWKTRRTSKQINLNWYRPVDGGANTEDNNTSLGCYFKFNEGVTGTSLDSTVLDYSGRLTNGSWTGYASGARSTDSCFVSAGVLSAEPADPIIYSNHPSVAALQSEMQTSGSEYDQVNSTLLYDKLPGFMRDDDEANGLNIKNLYQIISSYFDTIYAQTKVLPEITNKNYLSSSTKPLPFANRLLESRGFETSELFVDTEILEFYGDNDYENKKFEDNVNDIKNLIYHNIYNNLDYIYKTKGSEKSFRNLLRCFGIDDELVKFNVYTDGGTHYFNDNFKDTSITAKYINHNDPSYFGASVYQTSSANNSLSYISGSGAEKLEKYNAFTFEVDTIIPEKLPATDPAFFDTRFLSASIGGFHQATGTDYDWATNEIANAQIYLVRDKIESNRAKFLLTNQDGTLFLTSSYYDEIYDNERWVLAVRVKPTAYPIIGSMLTASNPTYEVSFYGVNHEFGEVQNEFSLSTTVDYTSGSSYLSEPKRVYVGAHRQNFTGSVLENTDVQVGACRFWMDYLTDTDLKGHSKDITNLGVDNSTRNSTLFATDLTNVPIPRSDTLALNWDFDLVTSSSAGGSFSVVDVSSGSLDTIYGWIDNVIRREHEATSIGFGSSATSFVDKELVYASKKELPEISVTSDNVFIKDDLQKFFIKDDDVSDNFYSLEKSMYQVISEEMLSMFASAIEFNNLMGQAVDRYRHRYKHLDKMRQLFFEKIESDMDFDRFTEYYKWIDSAISEMMVQLYPASVRHSDSIANMVESHILERNKYQNKFPLTERLASTEGSVRGVAELDYNWKFGHAPPSGSQPTAVITIAANPTVGDTLTFGDGVSDSKVYEFVTTVTDADTQIRIGGAPSLPPYDAITRTRTKTKLESDFDVSITINGNDLEITNNLFINRSRGNFSISETFTDASNTVSGFAGGRDVENENCLWNKERKERTDISDRETIRQVINNRNDATAPTLYKTDGTSYQGSTFAINRLSKPYKESISFNNSIHGGINYNKGKDRDFVYNATYIHGPVSKEYPKGIPQNIMVVGVGEGQGTDAFIDCVDVEVPNEKRKWRFSAVQGRFATGYNPTARTGKDYEYKVKSSLYWPSNVISGNVNSGYNKQVVEKFKSGSIITNLHSDTFSPTNDIGMQGPFTEAWVGGHQSRHINLNKIKGPSGIIAAATNATAIITVADTITVDDTLTFGDGVLGPDVFTFKDGVFLGDFIIDNVSLGAAISRSFIKNKLEARYNVSITINGNDLEITNNYAGVAGNVTLSETFTSANNTVSGFTGGGPATFRTVNNLDDQYSRPEGWRLLLKECPDPQGAGDGAMGFVGPDYGGPYPDYTRKYAIRYRDERAKRPINVRNIRTTTGSVVHGNFAENYEVFNTTGRLENRRGSTLTTASVLSPFYDGLPQTTQEASLIGVAPTINSTAVITVADTITANDTLTFGDGVLGPDVFTFVDGVNTGDFIIDGSNLGAAISRSNIKTKLEARYNVSITIDGNNLNVTNNNVIGIRADVALSSSFTTASNFVSGFEGSQAGGGNVASVFNGSNRIPNEIKDQEVYDANVRSNSIIATRFSAPGGFETMSEVYLDVPSKEYSAYNALPFRNLLVRGSGSGEAGTIRVNSHANRREGLRTLLARHSGRFGIDSQYGAVTSENYNAEASFNKINRNTRVHVETGSLIITSSFDNFNVSRPIPSQDYGYSWVTASLGEELSVRSGNQLSFGYWPKDGILSASANLSWRRNGFDSAVNFPTGSEILGS